MMVPVGSFLFAYAAHLLALRLRAEGIFAVSQHYGWGYGNWRYVLASGGFRVWVSRADVGAAREVILKVLDGTFRRELEREFGDLDDEVCPSCGSYRFRSRSSYSDILTLLVLMPLGVSMTARPIIHICDECQTNWKSA